MKLEDKIILNVKRLLKLKKLSQRYLAHCAGFSNQMVSYILNKERKLNLNHVESFCKALDVEIFELII